MSKESFSKLINGFCALTGLKEADRVINGDWIKFNDVGFSLVHVPFCKTPTFSIYADFGPIPPQKEASICRVLLEVNLHLHVDAGPVFSVSEKEKNVICAQRYLTDDVKPEKLRELVVNMSELAHEWRKNYFLDVKGDTLQKNRAAFIPGLRNREPSTGKTGVE